MLLVGSEKCLPVLGSPARRMTHQLIDVVRANTLAAEAQAQLFEVDEAHIGFAESVVGLWPALDEKVLAVQATVLQAMMVQACAGVRDGFDDRLAQGR